MGVRVKIYSAHEEMSQTGVFVKLTIDNYSKLYLELHSRCIQYGDIMLARPSKIMKS